MTERDRDPGSFPSEEEMDLILEEWQAWTQGAFSEIYPGGYGEAY
jgi:hypothetical protein